MSTTRNRLAAAKDTRCHHPTLADAPADLSQAADADFSQQWGRTADWLEGLKRLVEGDMAFSAQKFANYLEAETQLCRRMPELRAVCQEARRLCQANPRVSSQVAIRVGHIQSTWLAIESCLAEFKSQRSLLAVLSGDLKQLESCQKENSNSPRNLGQEDHFCCSKKIEILDSTVQRKEGQLQQMRSVIAAVSKLLDWLCRNELLLKSTRERRVGRVRSSVRSSTIANQSPTVSDQMLDPSTGSTTYLRTQSNTDGGVPNSQSSDSSEIIAQSGTRNQNQNDNHGVSQQLSSGQLGCDSQDTAVGVAFIGAGSGFEPADRSETQRQPHTIKSVTPDAAVLTLSPLLRTVSDRVAALKSQTYVVHASLQADSHPSSDTEAEDSDNSESQLNQLATTEAVLSTWQTELLGLRASVLAAAAVADPPDEAIFRRGYLESITLLNNWTGSLRDRCRTRQLALRSPEEKQSAKEVATSSVQQDL